MEDKIILRLAHFVKPEDFKKISEEWEKKIPNAIVIPTSLTVEDLKGFQYCPYCGKALKEGNELQGEKGDLV